MSLLSYLEQISQVMILKNVDINYLKDSLQSYHDILDDISYQYSPPKYYINDKDDKKNIFTLIEKNCI